MGRGLTPQHELNNIRRGRLRCRTAVGEGSGNDTLTAIENVQGTGFDDTLSGDGGVNRLDGGQGDDVLRGRGGNDVLVGGDGSDTASYDDVTSTVSVDLGAGTVSGTDVGSDTLSGIEKVVTGSGDDVLKSVVMTPWMEGSVTTYFGQLMVTMSF